MGCTTIFLDFSEAVAVSSSVGRYGQGPSLRLTVFLLLILLRRSYFRWLLPFLRGRVGAHPARHADTDRYGTTGRRPFHSRYNESRHRGGRLDKTYVRLLQATGPARHTARPGIHDRNGEAMTKARSRTRPNSFGEIAGSAGTKSVRNPRSHRPITVVDRGGYRLGPPPKVEKSAGLGARTQQAKTAGFPMPKSSRARSGQRVASKSAGQKTIT